MEEIVTETAIVSRTKHKLCPMGISGRLNDKFFSGQGLGNEVVEGI